MRKPGKMMKLALGSAGKKPATVPYPYKKLTMPERFRGRITADSSKCIGCKLCMRDCPSGAITINKIGEKRFEVEIDLGKCIYCAQCVDSCNKSVLSITPDYELAQLDKRKFKITYPNARPPEDTPEKP
jgi:formate hydrogenlyase subunit 6/NADH:ubiquinone oxidoreductase subunit I